MDILIVEDDPFKCSDISDEIRALSEDITIYRASSLQEGMDKLSQYSFGCVILDMAIPSHASEAGMADIYSQPVGGLDILMELSMSQRAEKIIVMTQYPTIEYNREHVQLGKMIGILNEDGIDNVVAVIWFTDDGRWRNEMRKALEVLS